MGKNPREQEEEPVHGGTAKEESRQEEAALGDAADGPTKESDTSWPQTAREPAVPRRSSMKEVGRWLESFDGRFNHSLKSFEQCMG